MSNDRDGWLSAIGSLVGGLVTVLWDRARVKGKAVTAATKVAVIRQAAHYAADAFFHVPPNLRGSSEIGGVVNQALTRALEALPFLNEDDRAMLIIAVCDEVGGRALEEIEDELKETVRKLDRIDEVRLNERAVATVNKTPSTRKPETVAQQLKRLKGPKK